MSTTYKDAGVDPEHAGKILAAFASFQRSRPCDPNIVTGIGPFASCYSLRQLLVGQSDPLLATSCDGVGTKSILALEWGMLEGLGQDLVAMNVNDLLCVGAAPVLFLDYYACGELDETQLGTLLRSIQYGCELAGCSLVGGETAEMPGLYRKADFDLAGFVVGIVDRAQMLGSHRVVAGAKLLALPSSGFHSNGYSLVRKLVENERVRPEDEALGSGRSWKELLLAPTTIYVDVIRPFFPQLLAAAHITGGGLFENLVRVIPRGLRAVVSKDKWWFQGKVPDLFAWAGRTSSLSQHELLSTFNCGVGMILVLSPESFHEVKNGLQSRGVAAWEVGDVTPGSSEADPIVEWK